MRYSLSNYCSIAQCTIASHLYKFLFYLHGIQTQPVSWYFSSGNWLVCISWQLEDQQTSREKWCNFLSDQLGIFDIWNNIFCLFLTTTKISLIIFTIHIVSLAIGWDLSLMLVCLAALPLWWACSSRSHWSGSSGHWVILRATLYYSCMKVCHPDLSGDDPDVTNFRMSSTRFIW